MPLVERGEKIRVYANRSELTDDGVAAPDNIGAVFLAGKQQMQTMHLLIKTQLLICRRHEKEMTRLKYPAYSILFSCIKLPAAMPSEDDNGLVLQSAFAKSEYAAFVQSTVELIFRTCLISPQNSEELVTENGVSTLAGVLSFYVRVALTIKKSPIDSDSRAYANLASDETVADIIAFSVRTLSGVAYYETGRDAMTALPELSRFHLNWRRCLDGSLFLPKEGQLFDAPMKRYALEGIANIAKDPKLQETLVGCGILWPLLEYTLVFDPSLEQTSAGISGQDDIGLSVASNNIVAHLSIRALGVLSGLYGDSPKNTPISHLLNVLLTHPIARMLRNKRTGAILRVLNTNIERADVIWNVQMRQQLESLLSRLKKERTEAICRSVTDELGTIGDFSYDALREEVRIGGIYVRFFNKGGKEALSHVEKPDQFFFSIVNFIARSLNNTEHPEGWVEIPVNEEPSSTCFNDDVTSSLLTSTDFLLGMNALRILCRVDGLVDEALHRTPNIIPSMLLSLLDLPLQSEVRNQKVEWHKISTSNAHVLLNCFSLFFQTFDIGSDILFSLSSKQSFADAVTRENALWRLLQQLERPESDEGAVEGTDCFNSTDSSHFVSERKARGWSYLGALSSSPSIAECILSTSIWIELVGVLVGYAEFTKLWTARMGAAKTLSRLLWDPKTGSLAGEYT